MSTTTTKTSSLQVFKTLSEHFEKQQYATTGIYWLEGDESFFIDEVVRNIEQKSIPPEFQTLNQVVLFGQDVQAIDVVATAKQVPFGYQRQTVIIKDAQKLAQLDALTQYVSHPSPYTLLVFAYRNKKLDKRSALYKALQKDGHFYSFSPLYPRELDTWLGLRIHHYGIKLSAKAAQLLLQNIGNNLPLMDAELKKLSLYKSGATINEDLIYKHIGINREYNNFELQSALAQKDLKKAYQIIRYFEQNEKSNPPQLVLVALYNYFSKLYLLYGMGGGAGKADMASAIGVHPFFIDEYLQSKRHYPFEEVCFCIQLIHQYYKKSVGIDSSPMDRESLLSELFFKMVRSKDLLSWA